MRLSGQLKNGLNFYPAAPQTHSWASVLLHVVVLADSDPDLDNRQEDLLAGCYRPMANQDSGQPCLSEIVDRWPTSQSPGSHSRPQVLCAVWGLLATVSHPDLAGHWADQRLLDRLSACFHHDPVVRFGVHLSSTDSTHTYCSLLNSACWTSDQQEGA